MTKRFGSHLLETVGYSSSRKKSGI